MIFTKLCLDSYIKSVSYSSIISTNIAILTCFTLTFGVFRRIRFLNNTHKQIVDFDTPKIYLTMRLRYRLRTKREVGWICRASSLKREHCRHEGLCVKQRTLLLCTMRWLVTVNVNQTPSFVYFRTSHHFCLRPQPCKRMCTSPSLFPFFFYTISALLICT